MRYVSEGKFEQIVNKEIERLKTNTDVGIDYIMCEDWESYEIEIENQALYNVRKKI